MKKRKPIYKILRRVNINMNENKSRDVLFVMSGTGFSQYLFADLYSDERVTVIKGFLKRIHNPVISFIRRVWFSRTVNSIINMPFKNIWKCALRDVNWSHETKYSVVFMGTSLYFTDYKFLSKIREKYDVKYILILLDPWENEVASKTAQCFEKKMGFDYIFSFDPTDVEKYDFIYTNVPYSTLFNETKQYITDYDIYLAANVKTKGGAKLFHDIYNHLKSEKVRAHYRLVNVPNKEKIYNNDIIYNHHIEYPEVVKGVKESNCILEILPTDQSGATLRYYESVLYNKKLLTNNKDVVNLPFYNPEYMHVFEKPEDIDWDWVKERIPIDYHYDGRFSPTHLIDRIIELEEEKEGEQNAEKETP